ncbi:MAG: hypothetical protein LBD68_02580 [Zoogloeaceae bacterium]|nr:hypothetical protein [Zoogloeaceae bacterium]
MNPFTQNPEFHRNLWLEFSPQRLIIMPAVILLALFAVGTVADKNTLDAILLLSITGFGVLTIIWGCLKASNTLRDELSDGTWDNQRMSSLTPWQMTWGKLLGGPIYAWYGGGILLLVIFLASGLAEQITGSGILEHFFAHGLLRGMISLTLLALLMQAIGMMLVLTRWQRQPGKKPSRVGVIGLLILLWVLGSIFPRLAARSQSNGFGSVSNITSDWYGIRMGEDFMLVSLFALTAWAVIGLWQLMRRELQNRNHPWWWPAFLLFWIVWSAGFVGKTEVSAWFKFFCVCAALIWVSVYVLIASERKDYAFWIRFVAAWRRRDGVLLQHLLPNWLISFAMALVLSLAALSLILFMRGGSPEFFSRGALFLISLLAFVLRDAAWILWLNLAPGARRADGAAIVSLAVAYCLLPLISTRVFLPAGGFLRGLFDVSHGRMPESEIDLGALMAHIALAAVTLWLFYFRFRKTFAGKT